MEFSLAYDKWMRWDQKEPALTCPIDDNFYGQLGASCAWLADNWPHPFPSVWLICLGKYRNQVFIPVTESQPLSAIFPAENGLAPSSHACVKIAEQHGFSTEIRGAGAEEYWLLVTRAETTP